MKNLSKLFPDYAGASIKNFVSSYSTINFVNNIESSNLELNEKVMVLKNLSSSVITKLLGDMILKPTFEQKSELTEESKNLLKLVETIRKITNFFGDSHGHNSLPKNRKKIINEHFPLMGKYLDIDLKNQLQVATMSAGLLAEYEQYKQELILLKSGDAEQYGDPVGTNWFYGNNLELKKQVVQDCYDTFVLGIPMFLLTRNVNDTKEIFFETDAKIREFLIKNNTEDLNFRNSNILLTTFKRYNDTEQYGIMFSLIDEFVKYGNSLKSEEIKPNLVLLACNILESMEYLNRQKSVQKRLVKEENNQKMFKEISANLMSACKISLNKLNEFKSALHNMSDNKDYVGFYGVDVAAFANRKEEYLVTVIANNKLNRETQKTSTKPSNKEIEEHIL